MSSYDGTTNPGNHLSTFNIVMRASNVNHELRCMLFPTSLTSPAKSWFDKFRRHSITSWDNLSSKFKKQFREAKTIKTEASSLSNIKQKTGETLKQYLARFNIEAARARDVDDSSYLMAIRVGILTTSVFWEDLQRKPVYTLTEFTRRAQHAVKRDNKYVPLYHVHTELNESRERVYVANKKTMPFRRSDPMKGSRGKRDMSK